MFEQAGNSHWNNCWHFPDMSSDIAPRWARESTSLDINKANGMLTSNAKRIFCDNVTCFGTNKFCSNRSHLQELCKSASSAPHFLLERVITAFNLFSNQSFPHTPCSFPLSVSCRRKWLQLRVQSQTLDFSLFIGCAISCLLIRV